MLEQSRLDKVVWKFVSTEGWNQLFDIVEKTYLVATLEVLSTIKIDRQLNDFDRACYI